MKYQTEVNNIGTIIIITYRIMYLALDLNLIEDEYSFSKRFSFALSLSL